GVPRPRPGPGRLAGHDAHAGHGRLDHAAYAPGAGSRPSPALGPDTGAMATMAGAGTTGPYRLPPMPAGMRMPMLRGMEKVPPRVTPFLPGEGSTPPRFRPRRPAPSSPS